MSIPIAGDSYFQGLLSQRLGPDRLIDDELVLLIIEDRDFQRLCKIYSAPNGDVDGVAARVAAKASSLSLPTDQTDASRTPHDWAVWSAVLDDPRFDLVWKRALDELREPLPVVRHSLFERLLAFLSKFKKPAEAASVLPLLLGTIAATSVVWVAPVAWNLAKEKPSEPRHYEGLQETNEELKKINENLNQLTATIKACGKCNGTTLPQPPPFDPSRITDEMKQQGESTRTSIKGVVDAVQTSSSSVISLKNSTDKNLQDLGKTQTGMRADIADDVVGLDKRLDLIEQHTGSILGAVSEYPPSPGNYINKTLADSKEKVAKMQEEQVKTIALQDTLRAPRFTVDSLRKGAAFLLQLRQTERCIAFQVLQMDQVSAILRYKAIPVCNNTRSADGAFAANDHDIIRLRTTPQLVSTDSGTGEMGLYLSLEQARGTSIFPPSGKRSFVGGYSKADWAIK